MHGNTWLPFFFSDEELINYLEDNYDELICCLSDSIHKMIQETDKFIVNRSQITEMCKYLKTDKITSMFSEVNLIPQFEKRSISFGGLIITKPTKENVREFIRAVWETFDETSITVLL
jgi:DUF1009 family protein